MNKRLADITLKLEVNFLMLEGWRFRSNWRGKLILQRSREFKCLSYYGMDETYLVWRDAATTDLRDFISITTTKEQP